MYLRVIGDDFTESVLKEKSAITDKARLRINEVRYEKEQGLVRLPIDRFRLIPQRKRIGRGIRYRHDKSTRIRSTVTIRDVVVCRIENNLDDQDISEIIILFGLGFKDGQIFVCSVEETEGRTCYLLTMEVSQINVEIRDESDETF